MGVRRWVRLAFRIGTRQGAQRRHARRARDRTALSCYSPARRMPVACLSVDSEAPHTAPLEPTSTVLCARVRVRVLACSALSWFVLAVFALVAVALLASFAVRSPPTRSPPSLGSLRARCAPPPHSAGSRHAHPHREADREHGWMGARVVRARAGEKRGTSPTRMYDPHTHDGARLRHPAPPSPLTLCAGSRWARTHACTSPCGETAGTGRGIQGGMCVEGERGWEARA